MRVAIVQHPPVLLDRLASVNKAVVLLEEAAKGGAQLVVFCETYIPGYPAWMWRLRPGGDWGLTESIHAKLHANSVDLSSDDLKPLCEAAKIHRITVVCGINERDHQQSRTTLYNTVVTIDETGLIINRHRKLMPTNPERMVWGFGDASGLKVVDTPCGRIGSLVCWENFMPLARYALYAQGIEVYIAPTYDSGDGWIGTLQHIAREGCCWVLGSGVVLRATDIPDDFPDKATLYPDPDEWINKGDSIVIAPGGEIIEGPLHQSVGILYAAIDLARVANARRSLDVAGHYARPDIFTLTVDNKPQSPIVFKE